MGTAIKWNSKRQRFVITFMKKGDHVYQSLEHNDQYVMEVRGDLSDVMSDYILQQIHDEDEYRERHESRTVIQTGAQFRQETLEIRANENRE